MKLRKSRKSRKSRLRKSRKSKSLNKMFKEGKKISSKLTFLNQIMHKNNQKLDLIKNFY